MSHFSKYTIVLLYFLVSNWSFPSLSSTFYWCNDADFSNLGLIKVCFYTLFYLEATQFQSSFLVFRISGCGWLADKLEGRGSWLADERRTRERNRCPVAETDHPVIQIVSLCQWRAVKVCRPLTLDIDAKFLKTSAKLLLIEFSGGTSVADSELRHWTDQSDYSFFFRFVFLSASPLRATSSKHWESGTSRLDLILDSFFFLFSEDIGSLLQQATGYEH